MLLLVFSFSGQASGAGGEGVAAPGRGEKGPNAPVRAARAYLRQAASLEAARLSARAAEWVTLSYDRFRNVTYARLHPPWDDANTNEPYVALYATARGRSLRRAKRVCVGAQVLAEDGSWRSCRDVRMLLDGRRVRLPRATYAMLQADDRYRSRVDVVCAKVRPALVARMARARRVELQICGDEFALPDVELAAVRRFAAILRGRRPSRPAGETSKLPDAAPMASFLAGRWEPVRVTFQGRRRKARIRTLTLWPARGDDALRVGRFEMRFIDSQPPWVGHWFVVGTRLTLQGGREKRVMRLSLEASRLRVTPEGTAVVLWLSKKADASAIGPVPGARSPAAAAKERGAADRAAEAVRRARGEGDVVDDVLGEEAKTARDEDR